MKPFGILRLIQGYRFTNFRDRCIHIIVYIYICPGKVNDVCISIWCLDRLQIKRSGKHIFITRCIFEVHVGEIDGLQACTVFKHARHVINARHIEITQIDFS